MEISPTQWLEVQAELRRRVGDVPFRSWLQEMRPEVSGGDALKIACKSNFIRDTIRQKYLEKVTAVCIGVLDRPVQIELVVGEGGKAFRDVPDQDKQTEMFVPDITEIPIKDDIHLMEIAPFTLQPRGDDRNDLMYNNVNGVDIHIKANPNYGLITAIDYDLVLMMQSWLADVANDYRRRLERSEKSSGPKPEKPPRYFQPLVKEMLVFSRSYERSGGNQKERIEGMLNRLKNTEVKISRGVGRKKRRWGSFSFIHDWEILEETATGRVLHVKIEIPNWIYEGIVEAPTPTILTYDPDYFLIKRPLIRFLYRLCRLYDQHLQEQESIYEFPTSELHKRSHSKQTLKEFNRELSKAVEELNGGHFFQWHLSIAGQRERRRMVIRRMQQLLL